MSPSCTALCEETPLTGAEKHKNATPEWCFCLLVFAFIALASASMVSSVLSHSRNAHDFLASISSAPSALGYSRLKHEFVASTSESVSLPGHMWRNISLEIEMKSRSNSKNIQRLLPDVRSALDAVPSVNSLAGQRMWRIRTKDHKEDSNADVLASCWQWENEMPVSEGLVELSSPINLNEQELETAVMQSAFLASHFYSSGSAQVNVDARCLRHDEQRLVGLLLIWERFDSAITTLAGHRKDRVFTSKPLAKKNPELLIHLQHLWQAGPSAEPLADVYNRFAKYSKLFHYHSGDVWERDGWRTFAVNVCHLLHVDCTHMPTEKNRVPKFGALEFRAFDSVVGGPLRLVTMLALRLVQASCDLPLGALNPLVLLPGVAPATDLTLLLHFLQIEPQTFYAVFRNTQFLELAQ